MERLIYLDHAATTPMRREAVEAMLPFLTERFANPSGSHRFARDARRAVDEARDRVADVIGCRPGEVVFTGCGTESDNAAITGAVQRKGGRAVCPAAEHHAVLHTVERDGGTVVPVDAAGRVRLDVLVDSLGPDVAIVSVMSVNNEVGSINDLAAVSAVVRERAPGALLHTDAVQAACWLDIRDLWPHVDLLSLSGHKFGGPKGVGVLAVRDGVTVEPIIVGGGQERERRSGTHNVAGIVATAEALIATDAERATENVRLAALRDHLVAGLVAAVPGLRETVAPQDKVAGSAHVLVEGIESESLLYLLDQAGVCASAASACASGAMDPSHVLAAMGVERSWAAGALRMSLGRTTTEVDIDDAVVAIGDAVATLRERMAARSIVVNVLVAMSGGVDSSVAAALLRREDHDVVGVTMRLWGGESDTGCCSVSDVDDARRVAQQLDIDHLVFNFTEDFDAAVVSPYVDAHANGTTPNPCIECNRRVKFARLVERAEVLGFDAVATGHHARIDRRGGSMRLQRGADRAKDQSYVVHMLDQAALGRTLFPVGRFAHKAELRAMAAELGLRTASKPDSQDVCFITSTGGRHDFLQRRLSFHPGRVVDSTGRRVGEVPAIELVTIGQRRGLGVPGGGPKRFVLDVDRATSTVVVGDELDLLDDVIPVVAVTWVDDPVDGDVVVQCSAHGDARPATLMPTDSGAAVLWSSPQRRVAPGQSVVFYDPTDRFVLGGGIAG